MADALLGKLRALESRIDESEKLFSRGPIGELADLLPQIIAEIERDAEDVERYRWLRGPDQESTRYSRWKVEYWAGAAGWQPMQREQMDSAIDAAKERT